MRSAGIRIGFLGAVGLVLLRVTIGWHFLYSGLWKLENPSFSSEGFLSQAKGPLAEDFYSLIPDVEGKDRLDLEKQQEGLKDYAQGFKDHYALSEEQAAQVRSALAAAEAEMAAFFASNKEELGTYRSELERLAKDKQAEEDMPFQQKRNWDKQTELRGKLGGWSKQLDGIWNDYRGALAGALTDDQRELPKMAPAEEHPTHKVDRIVTYTNIAIGACLIAGLFTRLAALGGFLFLAQIVAAQPDWPGLHPAPHPSAGRSLLVNKEFVEMMALFALMLLPVGRWAGLDFFIHHLLVRPFYARKPN